MNGSAGGEDLEFRHYTDVLRRRKGVILATILVALIAGFAFITLATPVYESTAQVFLEPSALSSDTGAAKPASGTGSGPGSGNASPEVATEVAIMKSASVADEVEKALKLSKPDVSIAPVGTSTVVGITASAGSAKQAARIAQTYADTYVNMHRAKVSDQVKATTEALTAQINTLKDQITPIDQKLNELNTSIAATTAVTSRAPLSAERDQLAQQRQTLDTRRSDLQQRVDRLQLDSSVGTTGGVEIVSKASVPSAPSSPQKARDLALALALGVIGGIAAAFVRDHLDDRITSDDDLRGGPDRPVLGFVPAVSGWRRSDPPLLVSTEEAQSPAADAYARLGTVLELRGATAKLQVIQVTGARQGDGKTTTVANLGVALARTGKQVVLVDANLRRPRLHSFFEIDNERGMTSVLRGEVALVDALVKIPGQPSLRVLPSGPIPPNPAELLAGQSARDLITRLRFEGHIVILDGPSLPASDALVLADRVDGVVVVAYLNETTRTELAEAFTVFEHVETPVIGTVLNGTGRKAGRSVHRRRDRESAPESDVSAPLVEPKYRDSDRLPSDAETQ